jgi:hypothetical protein
MHLPDFDHSKMQWDAWKAYYIDEHKYNTFVQFDTGEFVVCYRNWRPDERKVYSDLHLRIVATGDEDCPRLYVPGQEKPIPKSHLNHHGMQTLLLDLDSHRAVSINTWLTKENAPALIPERFASENSRRNVTAYYAGPQATPVGVPITRHYPQPLSSTQRKHIGELADASKVWLQMQTQHNLAKPVKWVEMPVLDFVETPFSTLTTEQRVTVAGRGFDMIVKEEHDWLKFD